MIHHISGCNVCGWRLPEPIEIETEGYQNVTVQHLPYQGESLHLLLLPPDFKSADMEQVRSVLAKAMLGLEGARG